MARVSFSQYNMWSSCPQQFKLNYIDKLGESSGNIHTIFGTAMHETIQHFLDVMYNVTKKQAMEIDLDILLKDKLVEEFKKEKAKQGEIFIKIDLKPPYPDTPEDWEDKIESAFNGYQEE